MVHAKGVSAFPNYSNEWIHEIFGLFGMKSVASLDAA